MEYISLYELNSQVKQVLKAQMGNMVWVSAEITSVQENRSGHCYLELVDKPEESDKPVAVARATIWAFAYGMIKSYFETTTGRRLERGMKVLVKVEVVFHEVYGYSLNVKDIDPTFTLGDLEQKRRAILKQLEEDGVIDMNKSLELSLLPKTIAVISSPTAAGLGDFMNQLQNNAYGYQFHVKLFPAVMQGEKAKDSIISVLEQIYEFESLFDVVIIIRGGGSQTELGCFDDYELAANIAQFPLPVIAGIGHERDETIADVVSFKSVKTPTAAAAFLIDMFHEAELLLEDMKTRFITGVNYRIQEEYNKQKIYLTEFKRILQIWIDYNKGNLKTLSYKLERATQIFIQNQFRMFDNQSYSLKNTLNLLFSTETNKLQSLRDRGIRKIKDYLLKNSYSLELAETKIKYVNPDNILKRGYSLTRLNGKIVKSVEDVKEEDIIETVFKDGKMESKVTRKTTFQP